MSINPELEVGAPTRKSEQPRLAQFILDKALELAELSSWESLRLYEVAAALGITLDQVHRYYRQKDDLAEAWFDCADNAMLADAATPDYLRLSGRERIHRSIMTWLNALSPHRNVTREMLMYKLELGHIHLQVLGIMRISRTVQWILESARSKTRYVSRILEEVGVTSIYLATFAYWLQDNSTGFENTSRFLDGMLRRAEWVSRFLNPSSIAVN